MPRPYKFERVEKLVAYETGFIPVRIEQHNKSKVMTIVFRYGDVGQEDILDIIAKLKTGIPFPLEVKIEEE